MSKKKKRKGRRTQRTPLHEHRRTGKVLAPPLNTLPGAMHHSRWVDERMPEMLWACLVRAIIPRTGALVIFRHVALLARELIGSELPPSRLIPTHTNLAERHPQFIERIVRTIAEHPLGYASLRPLLLFDTLPGKERWAAAIGAEVMPDDGDTLSDVVVEFLDHQSESSTDVRWLICIFAMLTQKVHLPASRPEIVDEFRLYPDYGDLRRVRPTIRSQELAMWMFEDAPNWTWSENFWRECHENSRCIIAEPQPSVESVPESSQVGPILVRAIVELSVHWLKTARTTTIDAEHEGSFAFVLYALRCALELTGKARQRIAGRLLLRTIVECRITLAYLTNKKDPALWMRFRKYGTGQAKLALLKIADAARPPHSVSAEALERIANEDMWDEFVDINLAGWSGIDLRKMAEESGTKDTYDAFYGWNSAFAHGQWAALRDSCLTTCLNPLHRLHRVPLELRRYFDDVMPDALNVLEPMIADLLRAFPGIKIDLRTPIVPPEPAKQRPEEPPT